MTYQLPKQFPHTFFAVLGLKLIMGLRFLALFSLSLSLLLCFPCEGRYFVLGRSNSRALRALMGCPLVVQSGRNTQHVN
jgi:hypothetical protein